jgi:predicted DNA-binding helix-hairpin-helix protein
MTTQFVVGAANESDREILQTVERAHHELNLRRAYFSAFHPIPQSPLADQPAEDRLRELRLYQVDFMLRDYGFAYHELPFDDNDLLPRDQTPKQAWADNHPELFPVEINRAPRQSLLRVPGIGPQSAHKIIAARRQTTLRDLGQLQRLGVTTKWAAPFIVLDGKRPSFQLALW